MDVYFVTTTSSEDRLSSLPDDILIPIISHLTFPFAVVTESLSTRWRGLWTQVTSINISRLFKPETSLEFFTYTDHLLSQIMSPRIDSFSVELSYMSFFSPSQLPTIDSWIESLTNKWNNVRKLQIRLPRISGISIPESVQRFILQTQTLESLELNKLLLNWQLPSDVEFNLLPNLRNLTLGFEIRKNSEWLKKIIMGCPLLEKLHLSCEWCIQKGSSVECCNQNLRRLTMFVAGCGHKVVINAPKLEYLGVWCNSYTTICFDEEPIALREAKIKVFPHKGTSSDEENKLWSTFYEGVSNASLLALNVISIQPLLSTIVFRRATKFTLDMRSRNHIQTVLSLPELCPVLDFLRLRFYEVYNERWELPKLGTLQGVPKRIHVEIHVDPYYKLSNNFEVVEYLLCNAINLAHFKYDLTRSQDWSNESVDTLHKRELELCKRLYKCPTASTACEVEFVGKFIKISEKAGAIAWSENREISPY